MPQSQEIELKLDVPTSYIGRLDRLSLLKGTRPEKTSTLLSTYFDTEKQKLQKKGVSLRVRRIDDRHVQTVKKQGNRSVGLFARHEWECDLANGQPDLDAARGTALAPLIGKKLRRNLKPIFETRVRRKVYPIHKNGSEIKLTVDRGKVEAADQSSPLCEIELELQEGDSEALFAVARSLGESIPVQLASKSKAERGYELIGNKEPGPVDAAPITITGDMDWATAFKIIARACLYQFVANEPALLRGDREAVHQMRIGMRRLRAAISLFKEMLVGSQTEAMKSEFKWITKELAPARELDVFIERVVRAAGNGNVPREGMGSVASEFRKRRTHALTKAEQEVASPRFRRLVLDAAAWIEIGDWTRTADASMRALRERPLAMTAAEELQRRYKKIRKQGAHLSKLDVPQRHKLRIGAKKLRYACEFFASTFTGKKAARRQQKFVARLKKMQDALGDLNDIIVHEQLARQTIVSHEPGSKRQRRAKKAFAAGRLSGREEARFASVMKKAERAYAVFAKAAPFWQ